MTLTERDKRALLVLGVALFLGLIIYWMASSSSGSSSGAGSARVSTPVDNIERAEKRLAALRATAATIAGKETVLKQVSAELAEREKGLIPGDTAEQAQAQLLQVLRRVARTQTPPIEIKQVELGQPRTHGDAYGRVTVSVSIDCRIDELVNYLASVSSQPEIVATDEIRLGFSHPKQKIMPARVTFSGIVPKRLAPAKPGAKGMTEF
jgi:hypothetical protein